MPQMSASKVLHLLLQRLHRQHGPREARGALGVPVARLDAEQPQRNVVIARPAGGPSRSFVRAHMGQRMPQRADLDGVAQRRARPVHGHAADGVCAQPCAARCGPLLAAPAPLVQGALNAMGNGHAQVHASASEQGGMRVAVHSIILG